MKKIFFGLATVLLVILIGSGYTWYKVNYGGTAYYVGKEEEKITSESSAKYKQYAYDIDSYQKDGKVKRVDFNTDHNLRKEAYLKLKVNPTKGVISWEEVKKSEVPKAALEKLKE
ncbi:YxeA family protein [Lactococcus lactis]|uniref:YxeA family protein n=1 Tax=Lactococcus lactis TaxID=1358 RepID=UPI001D198207|nr:YxeA family protein [Lactococcus lactis]MCC4119340.1 YxeA family protein [Lactococcus lactis]